MRVPDAIAPIAGFRTWALGWGQLWSAHGPERTRWPRTGSLVATCLQHAGAGIVNPRKPLHGAPDPGCACGIYGVFAPWDLDFGVPRHPWALVSGRVEGWGRVVLGTKGFRAELGRPIELFAETWWDERQRIAAARAADAYGVPLVSWAGSDPVRSSA